MSNFEVVELIARVCMTCGGSGKSPPGRPEFHVDWNGRVVFMGWSWAMASTTPLPDCPACRPKESAL